MAARPRGGDWLDDEIGRWQRSGVDTVLSLLEPQEAADLELAEESDAVRGRGMRFLSFPIPDRQVPQSEAELTALLSDLDVELTAGRNVALHCRQRIGRTGLVAACLLVSKGISPAEAIRQLGDARGIPVPETAEQLDWLSWRACGATEAD